MPTDKALLNAATPSDEDTLCLKYQKAVVNLLVLQCKLIGASKDSIDTALKPITDD